MARPDDPPARRWLFDAAHPAPPLVNAAVTDHYLADEAQTLESLLERATLPTEQRARVRAEAHSLVDAIRSRQQDASGVDALLREYDLSSGEGIVLMCLAEALLRIPDADTADRLIADKLGSADWQAHVGASDSLFVNASTWALLLTGAHRAARRDRRGAGIVFRAARRARRRAGRPRRIAASDAHSRPAVRDGRDDRGGAAAQRGVARAQLFVRHARRGGADGRRCRTLLRSLLRRDRGRRRLGTERPLVARCPERLREAVGALPAIRGRAERAGSARAHRQAAGPRRRRARCRHRPHRRRRGGRPARAVARDLCAGVWRRASSPTTRAWA